MSGCGRCVATVTSRAVVPGINDQMTASQAWQHEPEKSGGSGRLGSPPYPAVQRSGVE
jgi:hypothetical protein